MEINKLGRPITGDFTGLKSADGFVTIINRRESRVGYKWVGQCFKPGCMCTGFTFTHEYLVKGGEIKCGSSGHDAAGQPRTDRPTAARTEVRLSDDARYRMRSARAQLEDQQRAKEIAELEGGAQ
jgi:hypothetical protein